MYGFQPLEYLALDDDDRRIADLVIEHRARLEEEREQSRREYSAARTAGLTAQAITRWLGKNLPRLIPRRRL